jgi:hypothetical protein
MFAQTVSAQRQPEKALAALQQVATQSLVLKGARGEATETIDLVLKYLDE